MPFIDRRSFITRSLLTTAALSLPASLAAQRTPATSSPAHVVTVDPEIIDTNVNLFQWPYRRLKYDNTPALVAKLRRHRISQAWAGSYEALLHKNINGVNTRLAEECRTRGEGMLIPFGTVNPAWLDWEEDLRRCQEVHRMPGIRLYPAFQHCGFENPEFVRLLKLAGDRGMIVQIVGEIEEPRVQHPNLALRNMALDSLAAALKAAPHTKVHLVHFGPLIFLSGGQVSQHARETIRNETGAYFDISRLEGNGILGRVLGVDEPLGPAAVGKLPLERLLFATNSPYFPVEASVIRLFESPLNQPQTLAVMQGNAKRLLASARQG